MDFDLKNAITILKTGGFTCVLCKGERVCSSSLRGVKPLLNWLDDGTDLMGFSAADKVVGRGAAFLYRLLGVRRVHACVISMPAVKVLRAGGVEVTWDSLTEGIRNRTNTGPCPIEAATADISELEEGLLAIRATLHQLEKSEQRK